MKLREFILESALQAARKHVQTHLLESVVDFLDLTVAKAKNKKPEDLTDRSNQSYIDLDHLATIVTGLKVLSKAEYRQSMTKDDIGISPNDTKELFNLFDKVDKMGKDPGDIKKVFTALKSIAPTVFKKERENLTRLVAGTDEERKKAVAELAVFSSKVLQFVGKVKTASTAATTKPSVQAIA